MTRILDERDKNEIKQEMQTKDELLDQKLQVLDKDLSDDINELEQNTDSKITNLDSKVASNISSLEQQMTSKINTLDENINNKVDTLEQNVTSDIDSLEKDLTTQITTLGQNTIDQINDLDESVSNQFSTLEQSINTQISNLQHNTSTQIDDLENTKVDKDGDKVLSENDLTDELKGNYDVSYTHSQQAHAPSDAEMNVQVNWTEEDATSDAYILNKPTLGAMASKSIVEKSDLSTDVQESLGLIESCIQPDDLMFRVSDGYIQYTTDGSTWNNLMLISELNQLSLKLDDSGVLYLG